MEPSRPWSAHPLSSAQSPLYLSPARAPAEEIECRKRLWSRINTKIMSSGKNCGSDRAPTGIDTWSKTCPARLRWSIARHYNKGPWHEHKNASCVYKANLIPKNSFDSDWRLLLLRCSYCYPPIQFAYELGIPTPSPPHHLHTPWRYGGKKALTPPSACSPTPPMYHLASDGVQ